jgi:hypothetical protein
MTAGRKTGLLSAPENGHAAEGPARTATAWFRELERFSNTPAIDVLKIFFPGGRPEAGYGPKWPGCPDRSRRCPRLGQEPRVFERHVRRRLF